MGNYQSCPNADPAVSVGDIIESGAENVCVSASSIFNILRSVQYDCLKGYLDFIIISRARWLCQYLFMPFTKLRSVDLILRA